MQFLHSILNDHFMERFVRSCGPNISFFPHEGRLKFSGLLPRALFRFEKHQSHEIMF